ncbi:HTH-type transcriptional repressor of puuD [Erwinia persicina]|jgi:HTH-type transcriptional repressor of puuD|uniref:HTH-type transcriptional regulator PuuR n=2 Tax=Erwinia TaxID=551 RepID=A0ABV4EB04_9GAMM|nr:MULTISPECIES: HTH-type transcriptional regulator PuuR [Erwinia]MCP1439683.1 HTH-type transcriptional repressor of puuD [Erwinia persicina]MDN4625474.1 HTH-type transcriptional regulator PuuR [Erwinia sp. PsM31]MDN8541628.1 HTH-type transcriptional regulator PuuR [Erwinia sp. BC051422]
MNNDGLAPGKRLSGIRQQLGLSQRRVAELSGLTHSAISTIEQDKVSPAISTLQKLLKVYGLSLSEFFAEPEIPDEPQVVINPDELIEIGSQGVSMKLIHNGAPNRTLAMMIETYQPGTTTGERIKHQGEEIGTLLEGEVVLKFNGQSYHLVAQQSYAINTGIPHSFSNTSAKICRIISAHTPTTF